MQTNVKIAILCVDRHTTDENMIKNRIALLLERNDITAAQMARALDVPGQRFRRWVRQEVNPPIEIVKQLADKFQCSVEYVAGVDDVDAPANPNSDSVEYIVRSLKEQIAQKDKMIQQLMDQNQILIDQNKQLSER